MGKHSLRIVYMGTPDFAVLPLQRLMDDGFNIVGVVTNPDKPAGRGMKFQESAVKTFAKSHNLPILQPEKFRDPDFLQQLKALNADLQIVVAFKMLPQVVWDMPRLGTVNLHASLLPDYRGAAPINWAIINGDKISGVTTFLLSHDIDTGAMIDKASIGISEETTAGELHDKLMVLGSDVLLNTVCSIENGTCVMREQPSLIEGREPRPAPKIFKEDMRIKWEKDVESVYNHIRGLSPFPAAWSEFVLKDKSKVSFKIYSCTKELAAHTTPRHINIPDNHSMGIEAENGIIWIKEIQIAGKKRMSISDFLRGFDMGDVSIF